jgi:hypothetical protein
MSDSPSLQFDRPEYQPGVAAGVVCTACKQPVVQSYYVANEHVICSSCRERFGQGTAGSGGGRMVKAVFAGLGVALLGGAVWYAVAHFMNAEFALLSIAIGYCVGKTIRWASGNRGGRAYQFLAVLLTYFGIVSAYVPYVVNDLRALADHEGNAQAGAPKPGAKAPATPDTGAKTPAKAPDTSESLSVGTALLGIGAIIFLAAIRPFLAGFENIIGILIIAFGLWQAWQINRRVTIAITGPFSVAPASNV